MSGTTVKEGAVQPANLAALKARIEQEIVWDDLTYHLFACVMAENTLAFRPASYYLRRA
ncbi:MAG: hypothetical protein QCH35_11335 [Methanomicrobiaceae archaeon]|nr:hypothetical protein [Methanomicrobiaceae archaeon]